MKLSDIFKPLDEAKFNVLHYRSLIVTGMGELTDGYDLSSIGIVIGSVLTSFNLREGTTEYSFWEAWIASSALIGSIIGAVLFGLLSNKGRKRFYGVDVALLSLGALLQAFVTSPLQLAMVRFLLGVGVGADYVLSPLIIAEHSNVKDRGKALALATGMTWLLGAGIAAGLNLILQALNVPQDIAWKVVLAFGAVPAASVIYLRRKIPETPRYLLRLKGDLKEFEEAMKQLAGKSVNVKISLKDNNSFLTYFAKQWKIFLFASLIWYLFDVSAYTGVLFGPTTIAKSIGISDPAVFSLIMTFAFAVPGSVICAYLIDRAGRNVLEVAGFLGMALSLILFSYVGSIVPSIIALLIFGAYNLLSQVGPGTIVGMYGVELAPTKVRGFVQGLTVIAGRLGAITAGLLVPTVLLPNFGVSGLTFILSVLMFIAAGISYFLIPETKGKSLEEASMEDKYASLSL